MILQRGMKLQFETGGDPTRVPRVQISPGGDQSRFPNIVLSGGPRIQKVQVVSGGDPSRIPKVQIPGLAAWFKFGVGITSAGGLVSQWDDMSGHGRHLKQATATNQPTLEADNSITFDGVDNYLKCDAFTLNQPETVYLLAKQTTWSLGDFIFDGNAGDSGVLYQSPTASPELRIFAGANLGPNTGLAVDAYGVASVVFNGASSVLQINNATPTTGNAGTSDMAGFTLGARANAANFSNIQVKEVLVFSAAHNAEERSNVISYLAAVGGLAL